MEQYELELIAKYSDKDPELKSLWEDHLEYEKKLEKFESKPFLTPEEELEVKELKKMKLAGKTKLLALLNKYKDMEDK
ncbi:hypothetical protein SAMN04488516_101416 [Desulfonauticus submarinus]|uniref:DUF465 domain-containing protein n=1 Tax=Desulfonauticus submarinus TaxID=206665 RepID=A0A1H0AIN1_9BACT|nr:DUF465 domain-containing protein [Desulfonauticus submarinus]SDN32933.1 hypothetical protein SAMN04488516_101416 [Desulfonauticus submarinus]